MKMRATSAKLRHAAGNYDRAVNDPHVGPAKLKKVAQDLRKVENEFKKEWEGVLFSESGDEG